MKTEFCFRQLDPPPGGIERLQKRLERPRWPQQLAPAAALAVALAVGLLLWPEHDSDQQRAMAELRVVFEQARQPALSIDGQEPRALNLTDADVVVYWLD